MKYNRIHILLFLLVCLVGHAQNKSEREYRIKKSEFPVNAKEFIQQQLVGAKKLRFYKEIDSAKTSFEVKFKKDKLFYSVEFTKDGILEDIEIIIKKVDIPDDSYSKITDYLKKNINKYKIRKIQQQYLVDEDTPAETTLRNAFQNLIIPSINYELVVSGNTEKGYQEYEVLFDAEGSFKRIRKLVAPNYDHVLY